jgi:H+/Cl- antiporter ClcA
MPLIRLPSNDIRRQLRLWVLAAVTGVISAVAGYLLLLLIGLASNLVFYGEWGTELPSLAEHELGPWIVLVPVIGGLIVGLMARYGTPQICGHGIPEAMEAILLRDGRVSPRVAVLKPISVVVAIGTGGPFGAEGPIIQTGGALGSLLGQWLPASARERKTLLACGAAGGMTAIFGTPIAAVILAIELLLFEFRSRSFLPLAIAAAVATAVRIPLFGSEPLFVLEQVEFGLPGSLPWYALFGVICGGFAVLITRSLFAIEDGFERLPGSPVLRPALGGLALGLIGLVFPRVLGVGYETIGGLLNDTLPLGMVAAVLVLKLLAMLVTLGSGTSGGLLAPLFITGAALGVLFGHLLSLLGIPHPAASGFAVVGMAALFGASARAPFALAVFAFEITQTYTAIVPLMLGVVIASGVFEFFQRDTIMTEKLARRGLRVPQGYGVDPLSMVTVREAMHPSRRSFEVDVPLAEVARYFAQQSRSPDSRPFAPVMDAAGELVGLITYTDVLRALHDPEHEDLTAGQIASKDLVFCEPHQSLREAADLMIDQGVAHLPVATQAAPHRVLGFLTHGDLLEGHRRRFREEAPMMARVRRT